MATLVTGGSGFIGSHTCVEMLNAGREIVVVDNYCNSNPEALRRVRELTGKDFPQYEADVRDKAALSRIFEENDIDSVIHFAGLKAVGESVQMPIEYFDNNLISTLVLLEVMREHGCKRLVFSSSATVYGAGNQPPLTEEMPLGTPTNPYGRTKSMIEDILRDLCVADKEFSAVLLRYFNPIGAHPSGRIGENPNGIPNNLMPYVTQVAVCRNSRYSVTITTRRTAPACVTTSTSSTSPAVTSARWITPPTTPARKPSTSAPAKATASLIWSKPL